MCSAYVWPRSVEGQGQSSIPLTTIKKNNPYSHVAHGVFITFCDSSSLRFHLPLQKNWFHPVTYGGDMIAFVTESTRLVNFVLRRLHILWFFMLIYSLVHMLMMEVDEQTTDHKLTVPGSLAGGTRGSAQQAWGNRLETDPQQMQESRNIGQQAV